MSQDRGDMAEEQFFKGKAAVQRRRVSSGKQHRMFANVRGGEVTEYAFEKDSSDAAIVLSKEQERNRTHSSVGTLKICNLSAHSK